MRLPVFRAPRRANRQRGLSLIELMIAMVLGLLLLGAVGQFYLANRATFVTQEQNGLLQESGRYALGFLARDARMAGLRGCSSRALAPVSLLNAGGFAFDFGNVVRGYEASGTGVGASYTLAATNPTATTAYSNWSPALPSTGTTNFSSFPLVPGSDVLVMAVSSPSGPRLSDDRSGANVKVDDVQDIVAGDILLITDCQQGHIFQATNVNASSDTIVGSNTGAYTPGNNGPISWQGPRAPWGVGSEIVRLRNIAYYVGVGADGTPSLFRESLSGTATSSNYMVREELISGVDSMQVTYGVDGDGNFVVDSYVVASAVTDWNQVRSVRVALLVRSPEEFLPAAGAGSFDLAGTSVTPVTDRRERRVFETTIALRNRLL